MYERVNGHLKKKLRPTVTFHRAAGKNISDCTHVVGIADGWKKVFEPQILTREVAVKSHSGNEWQVRFDDEGLGTGLGQEVFPLHTVGAPLNLPPVEVQHVSTLKGIDKQNVV